MTTGMCNFQNLFTIIDTAHYQKSCPIRNANGEILIGHVQLYRLCSEYVQPYVCVNRICMPMPAIHYYILDKQYNISIPYEEFDNNVSLDTC
jgi:hypothetical protein